MPANQLHLLSLDVWGSEEDGFEVNQMYPTGITLLPNQDNDYYYFQIRNYYPHLDHFTIDWNDEHSATVSSNKDGKPLFEIQLKY